MTPEAVRGLVARWREQAEQLRRFAPAAATAFEDAALELETAARSHDSELLTQSEASEYSGLSPRTLRDREAKGALPNHGTKGAPRYRRSDLPQRRAPTSSAAFDPDAAALRIVSRSR